jgi:tRNA A37 methylthiotransferase MiaB
MKVFIKGLNSCAMRRGKTEQYRQYVMANGHQVVTDPAESNYAILWTCAFRADVRDNSLREIERYQREYPHTQVIAAGCLPDIDRDRLHKVLAGIEAPWRSESSVLEPIFGATPALASLSPAYAEEKICDDAARYRAQNPDKDVQFHDQFIKLVISEGCNYRCAYCSERLMFPGYRSFPLPELVARARSLIESQKAYNIVLLADSLGEYGKDVGTSLIDLIDALRMIDVRVRVALNNINPADIVRLFDPLFARIDSGVICHLNIPIQSASDRVLALMNRTYTKAELDRILGTCARHGFTAFDTHLIVGFPGEAQGDVEETIAFLEKHRPRYVLLSRYMRAPGMPAAQQPLLPEQELSARMHEVESRLRNAGMICNSEDNDMMSRRFERLNRAG